MQFYFRAKIGDEIKTFALVSEYSAPHAELLKTSSGAVAACKYEGKECLKVVSAKTILSVVAMVPYPHGGLGTGVWYFLVEKMGLEMAHFAGIEEVDEEEVREEGHDQEGNDDDELDYA